MRIIRPLIPSSRAPLHSPSFWVTQNCVGRNSLARRKTVQPTAARFDLDAPPCPSAETERRMSPHSMCGDFMWGREEGGFGTPSPSATAALTGESLVAVTADRTPLHRILEWGYLARDCRASGAAAA